MNDAMNGAQAEGASAGPSGGASGTVRIEAPAKVNLGLTVRGRRPDGYHDLETVIAPISLVDRLEVHAFADPGMFRTLSLSVDVSGEPGLVRGVPVDETNLVIRAAKALADRAGVRGFADVHLDKRIPPAAGLGGGSADAAAALFALNRLWGLHLAADEMLEVAAHVGSDVPALLARAPVRVRGRGEIVEPAAPGDLASIPDGAVVAVVTFTFGVSTAEAFGWWDEDSIHGMSRASGGAAGRGERLSNDLEEPVMRRHPEVRAAKERLLAAGAAVAVMCGSGPSVAGFFDRPFDAAAEADLARISGCPPVSARLWER